MEETTTIPTPPKRKRGRPRNDPNTATGWPAVNMKPALGTKAILDGLHASMRDPAGKPYQLHEIAHLALVLMAKRENRRAAQAKATVTVPMAEAGQQP